MDPEADGQWTDKYPAYPISTSVSFSTVDSSSSSTSFTSASTSTFSSSYSLSSLDTDSFVNDAGQHYTIQHGRARQNRFRPLAAEYQVADPPQRPMYFNLPFEEPRGRPRYHLARFKRKARKFGRHLRNSFNLDLSLWETLIMLVFAFYAWVLLRHLVGEKRVVASCSVNTTSTTAENDAPNNTIRLNSTTLNAVAEVIINHDHTLSGHQALVEEIVAMERTPPGPADRVL